MKIDAFCHVMPAEYAERLDGVSDAPAAANIRNRIAGIPAMVDLDLRFAQMDEFGPDYQQVISLPAPPIEDLGAPEVCREMARLGNEGLAALVERHPERFAGFVAALPMNDPGATLEEIDHACGELGALGVQIYTHVSMVPHFAGRVGPGWDQLGARTPPDRRHEIEHAPLSKRPLDYFKMFYADTAMFGAAHAIRCCIEFFGVDRILFASDTPFDPEKGPGYIRSTIENLESLELSEEDRAKIYEGNARRVLGVR